MISLVEAESSAVGAVAAGLRASSYNIYVDLPNDPECFLLVHGYTGAYDKVSRRVAAYVRAREARHVPKPLYGAWLPEEIDTEIAEEPPADVIERLRKRGYLTAKTLEEEEAYFIRHVGAIRRQQAKSMPAYVVMPSYDCNLRCHYCFQDFMRTNPAYKPLLKLMPEDVALRILDSLPSLEKQYHEIDELGENARSFTFFGGEPLTPATRPIVELFIRRAKEMGRAHFAAISNGTSLHLFKDLLGPDGISWLQITIDGPKAEHDKRRIRADGTGSFDEIDANIELALDLGVTIAVRVNVDKSSIHGVPELASHFVKRGWTERPNFSCYVAPVRDNLDNGSRHDYFNTHELGEAIATLRCDHADMVAVVPVDAPMRRAAMNIFTTRNGGFPTKTTFCGAHEGMYVFDPFADIYACWERTGNENIRMGRVTEAGEAEFNESSAVWKNRDVTSNSTCRQCRFSLHCGGGCAVLAEESSGTMYSNYCDAYGKRFRARVAQAYEDYRDGKTISQSDEIAAVVENFVR